MKPLLFTLVLLAAAPGFAEVLTLDQALVLAKKNHPSLQLADANVDVTSARVEQARGVLLPQVSATGIFSRSQGSFARVGTGTAAPSAATPNNLFSFGLTATQTLWDFGAIERLRQAGFNREALAATERATQLTVALNVRRAYFVASAQTALVNVAQQTLANTQLHLTQANARVGVGQGTSIDVAQAKTQVANAELQLINAKNALTLSMVTLSQTIGMLAPQDWQVSEALLAPVEHEDDEVKELVQQALDARPEVAAIRKQQEAVVAQRLAAIGGYIPTLNANGSVSEAGTDPSTLGPNWAFGVTLSWNLFNGLQTTGQVHEADAQARVIQAQLDTQLLQVRTDVEQARATVMAQRTALTSADTAVDAAQEQLTLAEARFKNGVGSLLEVGDAQLQSTTANAQRVQARLNLATARAQLLAALGVTP
ncbi:MAG: TolC family protein [Archangium sp.]